MASKVMHICIQTEIARAVSGLIHDANLYLVSAIAPDIYNQKKDQKDITHFFYDDHAGTRYIDLQRFASKYKEFFASDDFALGYYTHLFCDQMWLEKIFYHYIKECSIAKQKELLTLYYHDFRVLNRLLLEKYSLDLHLERINRVSIEEVCAQDINDDLKTLFDDFVEEDELLLLKLEDIVSYIDCCIREGAQLIRQYRSFC